MPYGKLQSILVNQFNPVTGGAQAPCGTILLMRKENEADMALVWPE